MGKSLFWQLDNNPNAHKQKGQYDSIIPSKKLSEIQNIPEIHLEIGKITNNGSHNRGFREFFVS